MRKNYPIQIRYRFERAPHPPGADLQQLVAMVQQLVQTTPWAVPNLPFGTTSRVSGGLLEAFPAMPQFLRNERGSEGPVRLKAIESPDGILLEHTYDDSGLLSQTVYPDGVCVKYAWNGASQLATVRLPGGRSIAYEYRENGLLDAVRWWPRGPQFRYQYDSFGSLLSCVYPDNRIITYGYDRQGRLGDISFDGNRFLYDWDDNGKLRRIVLEATGQCHELVLGRDSIEVTLVPDHAGDVARSRLVSGLGVWAYSSAGRLIDRTLPTGDRLCLRTNSEDEKTESVCDHSGQTVYEYDKEGILRAVLHTNGTRTVFHRLPKTHHVFAVAANGVTLYEYDSKGQLRKVRADTGDYVMLSYDRGGAVSKLTTAAGWTEFKYTDARKIRAIRNSWGASAEVSYGPSDCPSSISLHKTAPDAMMSALAFSQTLWTWTALKPMLRLEDRGLREV